MLIIGHQMMLLMLVCLSQRTLKTLSSELESSVERLSLERFSIFRIEDNEQLVLVRHHWGILHYIPNVYTAKELGLVDPPRNMSKFTAALFKKSDDIPSLIPASESPDEKLRVIISKIFSLAPANLFIFETHFLPG